MRRHWLITTKDNRWKATGVHQALDRRGTFFYQISTSARRRWVENECVRSKLNNHKTNSHKTGLILLALMSLKKLWDQLVLFLCWWGVFCRTRMYSVRARTYVQWPPTSELNQLHIIPYWFNFNKKGLIRKLRSSSFSLLSSVLRLMTWVCEKWPLKMLAYLQRSFFT